MQDKQDILSRKDVEHLVDSFYQKVRKDTTIGYVFEEVMQVDWSTHLERMYTFWSSILLGEASYKGTIMAKHYEVHDKEPLKNAHFDAWLKLWNETVNENFAGANADEALRRANLMGELLKFKINHKTLR